jgi:formyl-CoA transferase
LCNALGNPGLIDDERFINNIDRVNNRDELKAELESSLMKIDGNEIAIHLAKAGLAAGPIHDTAQVVAHPHTIHREMSIDDDGYKMTGTPIKLSRTPGSIRRKPPKYGEHTDELLRSFGFSNEEISELVDSKTVLKKREK